MPDVEGLPVLHVVGSEDLDHVEVGGTQDQGWQWTGEQEPIIGSENQINKDCTPVTSIQ